VELPIEVSVISHQNHDISSLSYWRERAEIPLGVVGRVSTMGGGREWWSIEEAMAVVVEGGGHASEDSADDADDVDDAEGTAPRSSIFTFRGCACGMCGV
jgi:hypothetical protein